MQATRTDQPDVEQTLDAVSRLHDARTDADSALFEMAAHFADLHSGDSLPRSRSVLPGMERAVQLGGAGTPLVAEFAYAELGARMQMGTWSAKRYVADALDVRHRLPLIWARVQAREARIGNARLVAARTRHLSMEAAAKVDAAMALHVDGSLPWGRFESRLEGRIVAADPGVATAREEARVRDQFAKRTRSSENGMAGFYVCSTVGVIARIEATVAFLAEALRAFGDTDTEDLRRVKAMVLLANPVQAVELLAAVAALRARHGTDAEPDAPELPLDEQSSPVDQDPWERMTAFARRVGFQPTHLPGWLAARLNPAAERDPTTAPPGFTFDWSRLLPSLTLYLHLSADDLADGEGGAVRWEGEGPVTHRFVHEHLRPLHRYVIRPVLDLARMAPVDAYELPDRLREAVRLRTPADTFPFSSNTSRTVDADHTEEYDAALASKAERWWSTRTGNLGPLGRFAHRIKTHGRWTVRQPFEGIFVWRDPHGQVYLVDHTGSRRITEPGRPAGAVSSSDPDIDVHPAPDVVIEVDFGRGA